jgi:hypothetical protein
MATTTPNFGWPVPTSTDLVKDGATAIESLGDSIDASLLDLKGGTTNQVLAKNSNTDMDFKWVADASGIPATILDAKGDLIAATAADTASRLGVGANGTVLTADSAEATGLKWATPASGSSYSGCAASRNSSQTLTANAYTAIQFNVENWDTNGYHDNSTNPSRFTVPSGKAGYYSFKFVIGIGSVSGDVYYFARVNNVNKWGFSWDMNTPTSVMGTVTLNLAVGDYVELFIYHTTAIATAANEELQASFDYLGA